MGKDKCISSRSIHLPFALKIVIVENFENFDDLLLQLKSETCPVTLFVESYIKYGNEMIGTMMRTQKRTNCLFADILSNRLKVSELPRECQIVFKFFARYADGDIILASRQLQLFDHAGRLLVGTQRIALEMESLSRFSIQSSSKNPEVVVEFISSATPIVHIPFPGWCFLYRK